MLETALFSKTKKGGHKPLHEPRPVCLETTTKAFVGEITVSPAKVGPVVTAAGRKVPVRANYGR